MPHSDLVIPACIGFISAALPATAILYALLSAIARRRTREADAIALGDAREIARKRSESTRNSIASKGE